jgi:hypothetical protein
VKGQGTRALVALVASSLLCPALGCSKESDAPKTKTMTMGTRTLPAPVPTPTAGADPNAEGLVVEGAPSHATIGPSDAGPLYYTVKIRRDAAVEKEDPDLAIMAAGRAAGARCFTGITDGSQSRSATIQVTVLPSGTVNRSEVSSGSTKEAWILSCLENVGSGLHFSDKPTGDIRTYSIGVSVTLTH